ncbi:MAG: hypothetical protein ACI9K2_007594 [Myxococcota bacterium]|jgi:hypothetical protein
MGLSMGVAMQWLPDRRAFAGPSQPDELGPFSIGLHGQISAIDLGHFLTADTTEPVQWNDFAIAGGQLGVILGTPSLPFILAYDVSARLGHEGPVSHGPMLGFYVPFLDFN